LWNRVSFHHTKYYWNFSIRHRERVASSAISGLYDERAVDGGPEERGMGVPPQGSLLARDVELVREIARRLYGAVRYQVRPIGPAIQQLKYAVPAINERMMIQIHSFDAKTRPNLQTGGGSFETYQWTDNEYGDSFTTWTTTVSPSLASMVGPGNCLLAVYITLFVQS
jgi:hypothetical protein